MDEHKRPVHIYVHTPHAVFKIYKILSVFISNKIQEYYNKTLGIVRAVLIGLCKIRMQKKSQSHSGPDVESAQVGGSGAW